MTNSNETGWNFDNSYLRLPALFFTRTEPGKVQAPELLIFNDALAKELGLSPEQLKTPSGAAMLAGNVLPPGSEPLAQAYAGHQFGHFAMLGDGRAVLLGEQMTPDGKRTDIQLKGAGRTPYSRGGDGRAAVGPMLREYIISEAMHALGIPTTRSLAVTKTGETVLRETGLPGAVLTRTGESHLRVGTFQYAAKWGKKEDLKALADYAISRHYPQLAGRENPYLSFLEEVIKRQSALIAAWQLNGFIHGVMNTDNMTISGETIDYGPCAFMDAYDPETVFSSIDTQGRYAFGNQPLIAGWNLARFAESLLPLIHENPDQAVSLAQDRISSFMDLFRQKWLNGMRSKLGLFKEEKDDGALVQELLGIMKEAGADYTNTFRALTLGTEVPAGLSCSPAFAGWRQRWEERLKRQAEPEEEAKKLMRKNNPSVIPRNHRVEEALAAAEGGDYKVMGKLLDVLADPYGYKEEQEPYTEVPESEGLYRTYCGT